MRSFSRLISAGVFSALSAAGAAAADLPSRAPPPPIPVVAVPYSWTGCHVGVHVGFAYDDYHFATLAASPAGAFYGRSKVYATGPLAGGEVGCDYQLPWNIVIGAAADLDGAAIRGSVSASGPLNTGAGIGFGGIATSTRVDALGSVRG